MPVITRIVRPSDVEQCEGWAEQSSRDIARDAQFFPLRPSAAKKGLLTGAAKVREALEVIPPEYSAKTRPSAAIVDAL